MVIVINPPGFYSGFRFKNDTLMWSSKNGQFFNLLFSKPSVSQTPLD